MGRRKHKLEEEADAYVATECPECEATITVRFQRGRHSRRLRCPICLNTVTVTPEKKEIDPPLIQLRPREPLP